VIHACTFSAAAEEEGGTHCDTSSLLGFVGAIGRARTAQASSRCGDYGIAAARTGRHEHLRYDCASGLHSHSHRQSGAARQNAGEGLRQQSLNRFHRITRTDPEVAAAKILRAVERSRPRVLIGPDAYFVEILQRLRSTGYWPILARQFEDPSAKKT